MGREFELKFCTEEAVQDAIEQKYGPFQSITMETTYFDTPEGALSARHITLRRRMENGQSVCTVKTPCADGGRGEWERNWDEPATMVPALCECGAPAELLDLTRDGIIPVCGARFLRKAVTLPVPGGAVELALDRGVLMGGEKEIPLCEVEVELKAGSDEGAILFARLLAAEFPLRKEKDSKFRRAQLLAKKP